jgi:hypothetical protein
MARVTRAIAYPVKVKVLFPDKALLGFTRYTAF